MLSNVLSKNSEQISATKNVDAGVQVISNGGIFARLLALNSAEWKQGIGGTFASVALGMQMPGVLCVILSKSSVDPPS